MNYNEFEREKVELGLAQTSKVYLFILENGFAIEIVAYAAFKSTRVTNVSFVQVKFDSSCLIGENFINQLLVISPCYYL
jgi:hypothetical protein